MTGGALLQILLLPLLLPPLSMLLVSFLGRLQGQARQGYYYLREINQSQQKQGLQCHLPAAAGTAEFCYS